MSCFRYYDVVTTSCDCWEFIFIKTSDCQSVLLVKTSQIITIPTQLLNANFLQFGWSRVSGKRLLYIDISPDPEYGKYFLCGDFQDTQYKREFSVIDDQVRIIRNGTGSVNKAHFVTQPNLFITSHNKPLIYGPYVCSIFVRTEIAIGRYIKTKWVG